MKLVSQKFEILASEARTFTHNPSVLIFPAHFALRVESSSMESGSPSSLLGWEGHYKLHAYVVMPDHIHLLLTPHETLERTIGLIKGGFSHRLASKLPVWQRGFTDHRIRNPEEFEIRRTYIHQNPVRANLVPSPELYPFSSASKRRTSLTIPPC